MRHGAEAPGLLCSGDWSSLITKKHHLLALWAWDDYLTSHFQETFKVSADKNKVMVQRVQEKRKMKKSK